MRIQKSINCLSDLNQDDIQYGNAGSFLIAEVEFLIHNIKTAKEMFDNGNYEFFNLPLNLQNKDCCEAYIRGLEYTLNADLIKELKELFELDNV